MNTATSKRCLFVFMCVIVGGCSVTVLPKTDPAAVFKISEFKCQPVTVINAQSATGKVKIGSTGTGMGQIPKTVFGDLREWTEVASMFLRTELQKRTVSTAAPASKVLRLAVTKVEVTPVVFLGGNGFKVRVKVDAGDGISKDFDVDHVDTRRGRTDAIAGAALAQLVANILNDEAIRKYICE